MTDRAPSRIAIAILELLAEDNPPLKGDLLEEFHAGRSNAWLWRQLAGIAVSHSPFRIMARLGPSTDRVVEVTLLVLVSFEVVFVTNVLYRLFFGPPIPLLGGYLYSLHRYEPVDAMAVNAPLDVWISACARALVVAVPVGWALARQLTGASNQRWPRLVIVASVLLWALLIVPLPFFVQFFSMLTLTTGLLIGGRVGARVSRFVRDDP